jgi:hypothetical protein
MLPMITLSQITGSEEISDDLFSTGFDVYRASHDYSWLELEPKIDFHILAGEGSGGVFLAYGTGKIESRPILHVTSEGAAGKVASHLDEWLGILVSLPFWEDILKFSGNGDLKEMRITAAIMQREYELKDADILEACDRLKSALPIPPLRDPVRTFHDAIHGTDCRVVAPDGSYFHSLFNSLKSSDNPHWR